jgi:DNA-binding response OmpR family regulator
MGTARILVVDDQPDIRHLLQMTLSAPGIDVREAATGAEALRQIGEFRPDLVILDVMMPGDIDGLALCRRIRQDPAWANLPVILLSARGQKADAEAGMRAGANAYVVKPFSPAALTDMVEGFLGRRKT